MRIHAAEFALIFALTFAGVSFSSDGVAAILNTDQNNTKVDISYIPLGNALVLGHPGAKHRVIVFTDPDCPFCARLHTEMEKVVEERKDIVFFIKLFPLAAHRNAYWKAIAIQCSRSLKMMEDNFEGKPIPHVACGTKEIDDNIMLAAFLGITGTPTLILPDGTVHMGALPANKLIELFKGR